MHTKSMHTSAQKWLPDISQAEGPLYLAICSAISRDRESGRLQVGDRLPPQRDLADALGLDTSTVTRGYAEARRQGLVTSAGRRGSFIRGQATSSSGNALPPFDTGMNLPPIPSSGSFVPYFTQTLHEILHGPSAANRLQYQPAGGGQEDRIAGASWLSTIGIDATEDNVIVTSGAQNALHAVANDLLSPGDTVCSATFTYPGWSAICRNRGVTLLALASDENGIDPEDFARACAQGPIRAIYLIPDNDNPTTATLTLERRVRIIEIARYYDVLIIEDAPYGYLDLRNITPLAALAPERTWYICSLSKLISPSLRIAYLRAPQLQDALRLNSHTHETTIMPPPLNLAICTQWLNNGIWVKLIDEIRQECASRLELVTQTLSGNCYRAAPAGYHLWVPLNAQVSPTQLIDSLRNIGMSAVFSDQFKVGDCNTQHAVRLSIGGNLDRPQLNRSLILLNTMLHEHAPL